MMYYFGDYPFMGGFGWIFMLLFWALIIWAIIAIARYFSGKGGMCGGQDHGTQEKDTTPLDILKERYAKGEIDKKEFEAMKKEVS